MSAPYFLTDGERIAPIEWAAWLAAEKRFDELFDAFCDGDSSMEPLAAEARLAADAALRALRNAVAYSPGRLG